MTARRILVIGLAATAAASGAVAHTVGWSIAPHARAVALEFNYGGTDPMAFAEVTVTAPDGRVFQKGRADREGRFAFVAPADTPADAAWTVDAADGEGHSVQAVVTADSPANASAAQAVGARIIGWVALASVILCVALAGALIEQRGRAAKSVRGSVGA